MGLELQDVFEQFGQDYRKNHPLPLNQLKVMKAIESCRTSNLGGHVDECDSCGHVRSPTILVATAIAQNVRG